jgi:predicted DNA-binding transcriptional regulator AlpA
MFRNISRLHMAVRKAKKAKGNISAPEKTRRAEQSEASRRDGGDREEARWLSGPRLRKMLGVSAPTVWRWRQSPGFPTPKVVNGRNYFRSDEIVEWMSAQPSAQPSVSA